MGKIGRLKAMSVPEPEGPPTQDGNDSELEGMDDSRRASAAGTGLEVPGGDHSTGSAAAPYSGNSRRPSMAVGARVTYAKTVNKVDKTIEIPENMRRQSMVDPLNLDMGRLRQASMSDSSPGSSVRAAPARSAGTLGVNNRGSFDSRNSLGEPQRGSFNKQRRSSGSASDSEVEDAAVVTSLSPPSTMHQRSSSSGSTLATLPEDRPLSGPADVPRQSPRSSPRASYDTSLKGIPERKTQPQQQQPPQPQQTAGVSPTVSRTLVMSEDTPPGEGKISPSPSSSVSPQGVSSAESTSPQGTAKAARPDQEATANGPVNSSPS
eukprot:gb/GEZN01007374.1/.p1 GENE.gb/GEZN01007374.1/~~gb/GEZN01007374.1/.p1  ORF type:complete len:364 (-),score=26.25 gb/GEZN01007374.1/:454-1416(-)